MIGFKIKSLRENSVKCFFKTLYLGKKYAVLEHAEDDDCLQKVLLLLDVLNGFEDLSQR